MLKVRSHQAILSLQADPISGFRLRQTITLHPQLFLDHSLVLTNQRKVLKRVPDQLHPYLSLIEQGIILFTDNFCHIL